MALSPTLWHFSMEDALLQVAESQSVAIPAYSMYGDLLGYYYIDML